MEKRKTYNCMVPQLLHFTRSDLKEVGLTFLISVAFHHLLARVMRHSCWWVMLMKYLSDLWRILTSENLLVVGCSCAICCGASVYIALVGRLYVEPMETSLDLIL